MGKEENKLAKIVNFIIKIFWIFIIGSIFGFFVEMIYSTLYTRMIVIRKGLIYGPFVQVYGMGAVAYYLLITKVKEPRDAFFAGMIMGGILEYICSFFQEILFGSISWDYSKMFMNFNGRICLLYCFYWGIIAVMFLKIIYPWLEKIEPMIYKKGVRIFTVFLIIRILLKKIDTWKVMLLCLFNWGVIAGYSALFYSAFGIFTISDPMPRQLMDICIERGYYQNL